MTTIYGENVRCGHGPPAAPPADHPRARPDPAAGRSPARGSARPAAQPGSAAAAADHQGPARGRRGSAGRRSRRQGRRTAAAGRRCTSCGRGLQPFLRRPQADHRLGRDRSPTARPAPRAYVLASAFDEVWLQPGGGLGLLGVAVETTFLRGALDKLGVEPQLEQRHEYKNAADRVTRTEFTPAHRESLDALAASIFSDAVGDHRRRPVPVGGPGARAGRLRPADGGRGAGGAAGRPARLSRRGADRRCGSGPIRRAELLFADRWRPRRQLRLPGRHRQHLALVEVRGGIGSGPQQARADGTPGRQRHRRHRAAGRAGRRPRPRLWCCGSTRRAAPRSPPT